MIRWGQLVPSAVGVTFDLCCAVGDDAATFYVASCTGCEWSTSAPVRGDAYTAGNTHVCEVAS